MSPHVVALVAARDEADRIGATVSALRALEGIARVVVVDDGSSDETASTALAAGAAVLRTGRSGGDRSRRRARSPSVPYLRRRVRGKGAALESALERLPVADVWLLADGDLAASATALADVLEPVVAGDADLAIGTFPPGAGGDGLGTVKRFAGASIRLLSGFRAAEPLSGQRAVSARALEAARPLARGFGVETAMTIDVVRAGLRVLEVPADLSHRPTGRGVRGFAHRGRQGLDIALAVLARGLGLR